MFLSYLVVSLLQELVDVALRRHLHLFVASCANAQVKRNRVRYPIIPGVYIMQSTIFMKLGVFLVKFLATNFSTENHFVSLSEAISFFAIYSKNFLTNPS